MDFRRSGLLATASLAFFLLFSPLAPAGTGHFVEDFTTTDYYNGAHTNAWWDTATGELKLRSFVLSGLGSYDTPGNALGVAVDGNYAYIADGGAGLQILNVHFTAPSWIQTFDTPGDAWAVKLDGDYAYVADSGAGLRVIDVSDPSSPSAVGSYDTPGVARDVALAGDYAFVADGAVGGLRVIDISNPALPVAAGYLDTPGDAISIDLAGDYAYIADRGAGLVVADISDPTDPTLADTYDTPGDCWGVAVSGNHVFLGDGLNGIHVLDVSDPTNVSYVTTVDPNGSHRRLFVTGDYLYSAAYGYLHSIDISDPSQPFVAGTYSSMNVATTVVVDGEYAYVADGTAGGLRVIEVADGFQPFTVGRLGLWGRAESVFCDGNIAYVAESTSGGGLRVLDIAHPDGPVQIGSFGGSAYDVFVTGDQAFLATASSGLVVADVSDPANPSLLGQWYFSQSGYGVFVSGDYAYVTFNFGGLYAFDVSDPTTPLQISFYNTPDRARDVVVRGDLAFVADGSSGLQIIDVSNPWSLSFVAACDTPGFAEDVAVAGDHAYIVDSGEGMAVIDISDPANPVLVAQEPSSGWTTSVALAGNWAFVGDGMWIDRVSIATPHVPILIDSGRIVNFGRGIFPTGDFLFVADGDDGLKAMRVFHRRFTNANKARSLPINDTNDTIVRVRLTATQVDSIRWEVTADGGTHFHGIVPGEWTKVTPGSSLSWRSTHFPLMGANPKCSQLVVDWLFDFPVVGPVVDTPDDNGGWVTLTLTRSGYDFDDEQSPVEEYIVWRRHQDVGTGIGTSSGLWGSPPSGAAGFAIGGPEPYLSEFPPGDWEPVDTVPASQQHQYTLYAPTLTDSGEAGAARAVFVVSAHTTNPEVWAVSAPESGYSRDNLPPAAPTGIEATYNTGRGNHLSWDECPDEDFYRFSIYRGETEDFAVGPDARVHVTACTDWYDPDYNGWPVYYRIAAVDRAGNESCAHPPSAASGIGDGTAPRWFALHGNIPNPARAATVIGYDVPPGGGVLSIRIYDVSGRLVRTLVNGVEPAGRRTVTWNGKSDDGVPAASGVYFCRMTATGFVNTQKITLVR